MKSNCIKNQNYKCSDVTGKNCDFFEGTTNKCKFAGLIGICSNTKAKELATDSSKIKVPAFLNSNISPIIEKKPDLPEEGVIVEVKDHKDCIYPCYSTGQRYEGELCIYKGIIPINQKDKIYTAEFWRYPGEKEWRR